MSDRKQHIVLIQSFGETRVLIKQLAHAQDMTIPQYLAQLVEAAAVSKGLEVPEYKTEKQVDRRLEKGDFKDRGAGKPKKTVGFFLPDTRKEWDKLFADRWEEFGEWYEATSGNTWGGPNNYYNNLSLG